MENTFDLKKFLVENKLTNNSRILEETGKDSKITPSDIEKLAQNPKIQALANKIVTNHRKTAEKVLDFVQSKLGINIDTAVNESLESLTQNDLNTAIAKGKAMAGESESEIVSEITDDQFDWLMSLGGTVVAGISSLVVALVATNPFIATLGLAAAAVACLVALAIAIANIIRTVLETDELN
jgi:hypothetical protein